MSKQTPPEPCVSFSADYGDDLKTACQKCKKRHTCKSPCFFVEQILNFENRIPFERNVDEFVTILFPGSKKETRESELAHHDDGRPTGETKRAFSDQQETPFNDEIAPSLKQTGVFVDRFFLRKNYNEIAEKYNISVSGVSKLYVNAKERLTKTVEAMDRAEMAKNNGTPVVKMNKAVQAFLLHGLFGLSVGEIAKLMGVNHSLISRYLYTTRDKIICGEIKLFHYTEAEKKAAQDRLEKARKDRREYDRKRG